VTTARKADGTVSNLCHRPSVGLDPCKALLQKPFLFVACPQSHQNSDLALIFATAWAKGCCEKGAKTVCHKQAPPDVKRGPANNTLAIAYWKDVAAHAKKAGWWQRVFDYTCDEPGADPARYPVCLAHAETVHSADPDYKVLITAEKKSADSVNISSV
jgi:hypothetical protein